MKDTLEQAIKWREIGISSFPLVYKSKIPRYAWRKYSDELPNVELLTRWFSNSMYNIGIACGGINNLTVIDFDDIQSYYRWVSCEKKSVIKLINHTHKVRTSRGIHIYLFTDTREISRKVPSLSIDIQSHGKFVVSPPSIHPSGNVYTHLTDNGIKKIGNTEELYPLTQEDIDYKEYKGKLPECKKLHWLDSVGVDDFHYIIKQIKSSISMYDYAKSLTKLKKVGDRWYIGRCPYPGHNDKNPSFRVDSYSNTCKCLSSRCVLNTYKGLDIIDFYCILKGVEKIIAVEELSKIIGMKQ